MEDFLKNPNEHTASVMLDHTPLPLLLSSCRSQDDSQELLKLLFQLNKFNILYTLSLSEVCSLISQNHLQRSILENLLCIEFPNQDYSELISKLFQIFSSEDIGASTLCHSILAQKFGSILCQDSQINIFKSLISSEDTVLKVRTLELIINLANNVNFEIFDRNGLIDSGIRMITSGDLLLQIVAIEAVVELGNSELGCKKLLAPNVQQVIAETLDGSSEPHFRNRLILMIGKIAHFTGNFSLVNEKYWRIIQKMIESNEPAHMKNALASIGLIASRNNGLEKVLDNRNLMIEFKDIQKSANQSIKAYFYHFFTGFLKLFNEEQARIVVGVIQPYGPIVNELLNPFQDSHSDILKCVCSFAQYKDEALSLLSINKFKEYLFKRPPHQIHEVSCLKFQIVENISKHDLPDGLRVKIDNYLKAGVFAAPNEEDMELESIN